MTITVHGENFRNMGMKCKIGNEILDAIFVSETEVLCDIRKYKFEEYSG